MTVMTIDRSRISEALRLLREAYDSFCTSHIGVEQPLLDSTVEMLEKYKHPSRQFVLQIPPLISKEDLQELKFYWFKLSIIQPTPIEFLQDEDGDSNWHYTYSIENMLRDLRQSVRELSGINPATPFVSLQEDTQFLWEYALDHCADLVKPRFDFTYSGDVYSNVELPTIVKLHFLFNNVIELADKATKNKV